MKKPLEELADEYKRIEELKKEQKAAKAKGNDGEAWDIKKRIVEYIILHRETAETAYKLKNYYREKQDRVDINFRGDGI